MEKIGKAYRPHPQLIVAGRPDAVLEAAGHVVHFNARGQRVTNVRDVPVPKPAGTYRIVCEGGSTTFDLLAPDDAATWPARLGTLLGPRADVVNAGFPGWTSLESLVSLEIRDLDLTPDLVVVFSGVNDLQPAGHVPFAPDYTVGHAEILPRVTGVAPVPVRLVSRLVFVEWLRGRLKPQGRRGGRRGIRALVRMEGRAEARRHPGRGRRRLRAQPALHDRRRVPRTGRARCSWPRSARVRAGHEKADLAWLEGWTPGLTATGYLAGLARYNAVAKKLGDEGLALFLDPFGAGNFTDAHFLTPCTSRPRAPSSSRRPSPRSWTRPADRAPRAERVTAPSRRIERLENPA